MEFMTDLYISCLTQTFSNTLANISLRNYATIKHIADSKLFQGLVKLHSFVICAANLSLRVTMKRLVCKSL